jgi:dolichol-phosphate mannosyltransferase
MKALVVVPTYNEKANLPLLVPAVMAHDGFDLLIVDDGSPDGTGQIADELAMKYPGRIEVMHRTGQRGLGRSYVDGLKRALATDAALICQMDADLSHGPEYLPALAAATANYDVVIGSRYLHGVSVVNWPLHRIFLSTFANRYIKAVTGLSPSDCTSGYRCWRRETLAKLPLERVVTEGYAFLIEMLYEASRGGARIGEVPIIFVERREGQSKISSAVLIESLITPWRLAFRGSAGPSVPGSQGPGLRPAPTHAPPDLRTQGPMDPGTPGPRDPGTH